MKILLACDHAGFEHKEKLKSFLRDLGYEVHDEGAFSLNEEDDYPDFIKVVAKQISSDPENIRGVIFGGSGQGEAMCANRYKGVRASVYYGGSVNIIDLSREHNDANVLSIGARFVTVEETKEVVKRWLQIPFSDEPRHTRRIQKIDNLIEEEHNF
jgi:ribose 5-phosphate isomerase B